MKMSNKEPTSEELIFNREHTLDNYAEASLDLYLPDSDAILFVVCGMVH
jgi:hypothetical protein